MKVLFFIESLRAGGKERRITELLKGLKKIPGLEIALVLTRKEIHYQEIYDLAIPIHIIERKYLKKDPLLFFKFFRIAKKFRPDIIHVWGHMVAVYAVPAVRLLKIPMINNEITDATENQKLIGKSMVFNASTRIIANTRVGLKAYQAPEEKSGVIYNGFNFSRLDKLLPAEEIKQKFNIITTYTVAMVATFSDHKDCETFVKGAIEVVTQRTDVTFLCIGDGKDDEFKIMVPEGLRSKILFLGKQSNVESIMHTCDIGVLTTNVKNHAEGISNALMEFMALGKPVIATNFGGSVELVEDGKTGFLIDAFNPVQLQQKIINLLDDASLRMAMGANARKRVEEKFSITSMITSFYTEYKNVLTKK